MDAAFDFQMPLLVVSLAGAAGVIIYLISVFGIREKTFEEAIAAQKEISVELLGKKEQKKKAVKRKVKNKKEEKLPAKEKEKEVAHQPHPHVEICSQPIILDENSTVRRPSLALGSRRDSIRSILVNKSEVSPVGEGEGAGEANHFELSHPKDDCELKKQGSQEDEEPPIQEAEETNCVDGEEEEVVSEAPLTKTEAPIAESQPMNTNTIPTGSLRKTSSKKPKKSQGSESELNATKLTAVIDKVTLSSDEIQNLIEYLLNRQNDAGITTEWVNTSKSDTTASLKKALAERENQLTEEQATVETLQQKLKDLRLEFGTERSRWTGMKKQVEDRNATLLQETQQLQVRLQQLNGAIGEKQTLERQVQELQRRTQGLHDENLNLKNVLSAEQSFRMKGEGLEREAEALRTQCSHLESQLKSSFQSNSDLAAQLRGLQDHTRGLEMKIVDFEHLQGFNAQLQDRENHLINELKRVEGKHLESDAEKNVIKEKLREIEATLRLNKEESERRVEESHQSEKNAKNLLQDTKTSLSHFEGQLKAKEGELKALNVEKESLVLEVKALNEKCLGYDHGLENRLVESEGTIECLTAEKCELNHQVTQTKAEVESLQKNVSELERENSHLAGNLLQANLELERTTQHLEKTNQDLEHTTESLDRVNQNLEQTQEKLEQVKHNLEHSKEYLEQTKQDSDQTKQILKETKQNLDYTQHVLEKSQQDSEHVKQDLEQTKQNLEQTNQHLKQTKQDSEHAKQDLEQKKQDLEQKKQDLENAKLDLEKKSQDLERAKLDLEQTKQDLERSELNLETELKASEKEHKQRESERKDALSSIQNELETLTGIPVQKNSKSWVEEFAKTVESYRKPHTEDKSADIQKFQGEVEHYQAALKTTESLLRSLEQSIEGAENDWKEKIRVCEEELDTLRKTSSTQLQNTTHLEAELELQREANSRLLQRIEDLDASHANSNSQKEDTPSIASVEELKLENKELKAEVNRLNHPTEVGNVNGTSPKPLSMPTITVDSKGGESRSEGPVVVPLSPAGDLKKKKKGASARK